MKSPYEDSLKTFDIYMKDESQWKEWLALKNHVAARTAGLLKAHVAAPTAGYSSLHGNEDRGRCVQGAIKLQVAPKGAKRTIPMAKTTHPQTLNFEAPMDAAPGKPVCIQGPHGPIMIPLPDDVKPGQPCAIRLGPQEHYTIPVPEGVEPGGMIEFKGAQGEMLHAILPPGLKAGDEFKVAPPVILVQVPAGAQPGQQVAYVSPLGQQLFAQVPPGLSPGHYFSALYEVRPADAAQAPAPEASPVPSTMSVEPSRTS